ncbi:MAG TPA: ABC transporter permease subunit, partial [Planctomycetota bacterium]|nr:ABC transporter permease subunit [Planctomycetota bacterium]
MKPTSWHLLGGSATRALLMLVAVPLLLLLLVPIVSLTSRMSAGMLWQQLSNPGTQDALWLSLKTSAVTTLLAVIMGTPLAYFIAKRRSRWARALDVLIELPMVFPPLIVGFALLLTFGRKGWLGPSLSTLGLEIPFTTVAVVIAQLFVAAPFYIKTASIGMAGLANDLVDAAAADGADWRQFLLYVAVPAAWPAVFCGAALCFSRALGEFGATMMFAGNMP